MGILPLTGWWTKYDGYVFNDTNRNGKRDAGEPGVPNFGLTLRKRENSLMDRGSTAGQHRRVGPLHLRAGLPADASGSSSRPTTIATTRPASPTRPTTSPSPTTVLGAGVDVSVLPIIGLSGTARLGRPRLRRVRRERRRPAERRHRRLGQLRHHPQRARPAVRRCRGLAARRLRDHRRALRADRLRHRPRQRRVTRAATTSSPPTAPTPTGKLLNTYVSETWERPDRTASPRDVDGNPLPEPGRPAGRSRPGTGKGCLEGPLMGDPVRALPDRPGHPDANFGAAVDGNYGFGDGCFDGTLDADDPANPVCDGRRLHRPRGRRLPRPHRDRRQGRRARQPDVQGHPAKRTSTSATATSSSRRSRRRPAPAPSTRSTWPAIGTDGYPEPGRRRSAERRPAGVTVPASTPVDNPTFVDIGGSPYEGQARAAVRHQARAAPERQVGRPDVQRLHRRAAPGRFCGLHRRRPELLDRPEVARCSARRRACRSAPVGIYDFANRLITTVETDYNGIFDVLLPSTNRINCPTPSGVCANLYRFVGNDPGVPGRLNPNYNPQYRTIAAEFEALPGPDHPGRHAPRPRSA